MRARIGGTVLAMVGALALAACGDDSDAWEDPPTMRRTTAGQDLVPQPTPATPGPQPGEPPPSGEQCRKHWGCCESLLRVPGAGGQPRSCFELRQARAADVEAQCQAATGRIVSSLRARGIAVPADCE